MATPSPLSFGARMLRKMGHQEGKGLGKDLSGIISPVEAHFQEGQCGLGYNVANENWDLETAVISLNIDTFDDSWVQQPNESTDGNENWGPIRSSTVQIFGLPQRAEPRYVWRLFDETEYISVNEIICTAGNKHGTAWVMFTSEAEAEAAIDEHSERVWGPESRRLTLVAVSDAHTLSSLNALLESDYYDEEDIAIKRLHPDQPGSAYIRFKNHDTANAFIGQWNGNYWKNNTVYAKYVPDTDLDSIIDTSTKRNVPTIKLFVSNLQPGFDKAYLQNAFKPTQLQDISIPAKCGTFAFVFVPEDKVVNTLRTFPKFYNRRKIFASIANGQKGEAMEREVIKAKKRA